MIVFPDRIYGQYRTKPKLVEWYNITPTMGQQFVDVFEQIKKTYDIDSQSGAQLDVIGRIIVESRDFISNVALEVYQCNTDGDNECGDVAVQCSATSIEADDELSDSYFRLLLKSKIVKNNSETMIDDILDAVNFIAPDIDIIRLTDGEDMSFSIEFSGVADPIVRDLLISGRIVPKPQGVRFNGFLETVGYAQCGDTEAQCNTDGEYECVGFIGV